jgi:signal transduction histidine kinase
MTTSRDDCAKLLSLAVHEFRSPVAVVSGYLRMVLKHFGESLTDQQRKLLEEGEKSCGSLAGLLAELGELANLDAGRVTLRRESVPVFSLLSEAAAATHESEDRGVRLEVRGATDDVRIVGARDRLRSAFAALLAATLRERTEAGVVVAQCALVDGLSGRTALVAIGDAGDATVLASGTDAGFDQYRGGMGFRLPLAERVIAAHGGRLASPIAERGRLSIVLSLPVTPESEITG